MAETGRTPKKAAKGSGTSITLDLKDYPDILTVIREAAKADDREVSKWLRRRIVRLHDAGSLFEAKQ